MVLLRAPIRNRLAHLVGLLEGQGIDGRRLAAAGRLVALEGLLPDDLPRRVGVPVCRVVHAAGSTRFEPDASGDPARTNDEGTRRLLHWMDRVGIREFHGVSTAYVCGRSDLHALEAVRSTPPEFRNAYERSKWRAEQHVLRWADAPGRDWTIYRPSIVVGDSRTGRAARFTGAYMAFRAFDKLSRSCRSDSDRRLPIRIEARHDARVNLIPVDYLAGLMASIIERPSCHGRVYNIVNPRSIPASALLAMVQRFFGLTGARLIEPGTIAARTRTPAERGFHTATRHIGPYLWMTPRFDRSNTADAETRLARACPAWTEGSIHRLLDYAVRRNWGRTT